MKTDPSFLDAQDRLERAFNHILVKQKDLTPPFFSSRYFGHMIWETTIPSLIGNFATLLYNPNNCAYEAAPYTTLLEIDCMKEFAKMFKYPTMLSGDEEDIEPNTKHSWGHLTCGGTVANTESMWAARNCRFLTLSIRKYIEKYHADNANVNGVEATMANGTKKALLTLTSWELLNVPNDNALDLFDQVFKLAYPDATTPELQQAAYAEYQNLIG